MEPRSLVLTVELEEKIVGVYKGLVQSLNKHSAVEFAQCFLENGVFVLLDGTELKGRSNIQQKAEVFFEQYKNAEYVAEINDVQKLDKDLVMLKAIVRSSAMDINGLRADYETHQFLVVTKRKSKWHVALLTIHLKTN